MKKIKYLLLSCTTALLLSQCATTINYFIMTDVPEESGLTLTQFTFPADEVGAGAVRRLTLNNKEYLRWDAQTCIDVSKDGKRIAYLADRDGNQEIFKPEMANIYIKRTDGGTSVVQRTFRGGVSSIGFSGDDKHIVFTDNKNGNQDIFMMKTDEGSSITQITSQNFNEMGGLFDPIENNIYYTKEDVSYVVVNGQASANTKAIYKIWSYDMKTSLHTQLTDGFAVGISPDGKTIYMTRNNKQTELGEIWSYNIETGRETLILSDQNRGFSSPRISSDGKKIVLTGITPKSKNYPMNLDIYTVNVDGSSLRQITFHPGTDYSPVWSPDSKYIFFISSRGSKTGKYNVWRCKYND
jgi:Tol biopolymer transport system component